jgi:FG-GAP-like repeat/FG-GAP repeat
MLVRIISPLFFWFLLLPFAPAYSSALGADEPVSFIARREFAAGEAPVAVAVGDFNGDGRLDLVTVNGRFIFPSTIQNEVTILLGQGDGTFQATPGVVLGSNLGSVAIVVADFNGDRHLDLAVVNEFDATVSILLGRGDGTFQGPSMLRVGTDPVALAVGDFNGDRHLDLAVVNSPMGSLEQPTPLGTVSILLGQGDGTFQAAPAVAVGRDPRSVAVGDFNGDRRLDLVVGNFADNTVSILAGAGDGTFQAALAVEVGRQPIAMAVGDFNGDGRLDLAVANEMFALSVGTVSILLGRGDGTFQAGTPVPVGRTPVSIAAGDFNGDGRLDVATTNLFDNTVSILLGQDDGTFQGMPAVAVGNFPVALAVGNFNGDRSLDIVTANRTANTVSVLLGHGDGTFQSALDVAVADVGTSSVVVGDFNGDRRLDIAATGFVDSTVTILLGDGNGTFQTTSPATVRNFPWQAAAGDFNGDGHLDLALANQEHGGIGNSVSILLGRGDGTFQEAPAVMVSAPVAVVVGDFNGDGRPDLAVTNDVGASVSIVLGRGDGTFQMAAAVPVGRNPLSLAIGDFNGDSHLDLAVTNTNQNPSSEPGSVSILLGRGDGTFQAMPEVIVGVRPVSVAVGDFNGDGHSDLAVVNQLDDPPNEDDPPMSILLGRGDGTFQAAPDGVVGGFSFSVTVADFNSDGRQDLAGTNFGNYVAILLGRGDGTFRPALLAGVGMEPESIAVGDFNGDGRPDLAIANYGSGTVSILINNTKHQRHKVREVGEGHHHAQRHPQRR